MSAFGGKADIDQPLLITTSIYEYTPLVISGTIGAMERTAQ